MRFLIYNLHYSSLFTSRWLALYLLIVVILSGFLFNISCQPSQNYRRLRVTCFPQISSEPWLNVMIADSMNELMKTINTTNCLTYPLDWYWSGMETDSTSNPAYLCRYAQRINLDILITFSVQATDKEILQIQFIFYHFAQNQSILQLTDSLDQQNPELFFNRSVEKVFDFLSVHIDSIPEDVVPETNRWEQYGWGRYYQLVGDFDSAEKIYRQEIRSDPNQINVLKNLAKVLLKKALQLQGEGGYLEDLYAEIETVLLRAIDMDNTDEDLYRLLGDLYIQRNRWNKAEQALKKAFEFDRDDPFLYFNLSRLHRSRYRELGFRNKVDVLEKAVSLDPAFQLGWIALGENYYYQNRYDQAEAVYHQLLEIHPKSLDGLLGLGKLYMVQNDILNIIKIYEKVIEIAPDYADAYYNLGIVYYKDRQEDEAIRFFQRAIELNNHADSYYYLALIYRDQGNVDQAVDFFQKRIGLKSGIGDVFAEEARKQLAQLLEDKNLSL